MTNLTFLCVKCNRRVPTHQVRMTPDRKYVCFDCVGYTPDLPSSKAIREAQKNAPVAQRTRYHCPKCAYEFYLKESHAKKCPYCNSERIEERQGIAEKFLAQ